MVFFHMYLPCAQDIPWHSVFILSADFLTPAGMFKQTVLFLLKRQPVDKVQFLFVHAENISIKRIRIYLHRKFSGIVDGRVAVTQVYDEIHAFSQTSKKKVFRPGIAAVPWCASADIQNPVCSDQTSAVVVASIIFNDYFCIRLRDFNALIISGITFKTPVTVTSFPLPDP